jgi:hypothetical protein
MTFFILRETDGGDELIQSIPILEVASCAILCQLRSLSFCSGSIEDACYGYVESTSGLHLEGKFYCDLLGFSSAFGGYESKPKLDLFRLHS